MNIYNKNYRKKKGTANKPDGAERVDIQLLAFKLFV